jgi:hypothetical protein
MSFPAVVNTKFTHGPKVLRWAPDLDGPPTRGAFSICLKNRTRLLIVNAQLGNHLICKATSLLRVPSKSIFPDDITAIRIYPYWQALKTLFILSVIMIALSIAFHLIMKRAVDILGKNPSDEQILKWGNFIELYYVPKCFIKKEKNPFIVEED